MICMRLLATFLAMLGMNRISKPLVVLAIFLVGLPDRRADGAQSFSDDNWSNIGNIVNEGPLPRLSGEVEAVATDGSGSLYVGGLFTIAGGVFATNIAKWNGSSWSALGSGVSGVDPFNSLVVALAVSGSDLYVGGQFTTVGGVSATNVAKWNGTNWSALGSGIPGLTADAGYVSDLVVSGGDLYAGGWFTNAGGVSANNIARWNGSTWSALGSGLDYIVIALAISGSNLYAGGDFTTAGGLPANYIAKWNGQSWSALGSGMDDRVYSLALLGSNVYAGGYFETAGGVSATNIARWDGSSWSAVGSGIRALDSGPYYAGNVTALAVSGNDLYAAGNYYWADGDDHRIARWNGSTWTALGSMLNDGVGALAVSGSDLYAGGRFTTAGGKVADFVAKARIGSIAKSVISTNSAATIQLSGVTGYQYDVQRATNLNSPTTWTTVNTSPLSPASDGSFTFTETNAPPGAAYYRTLERP